MTNSENQGKLTKFWRNEWVETLSKIINQSTCKTPQCVHDSATDTLKGFGLLGTTNQPQNQTLRDCFLPAVGDVT